MIDYTKGKIYRIVCNITGKCYYGSTCLSITQRLANHNYAYNQFLRGTKKTNYSVFEILRQNDYDIVLVEECSYENRSQLLRRERFYIDNNDCVNKNKPIALHENDKKEYLKQYYIDNYEKMNSQAKDYNKKNYDRIQQKKKQEKQELIYLREENRRLKELLEKHLLDY